MILYVTKQFNKSVKSLQHKHNKRALKDLQRAINMVYNQEVGSAMDNHPLSGKKTNGFKDLHLCGGDLILLYRYDVEEDALIVSAKLRNIINHDELDRPEMYSEPQWVEVTLEDLKKTIKGSVQIGSDFDKSDIIEWFFEYYNYNIAKILPIDEIYPVDIVTSNSQIVIKATGVQYHDTCPIEKYIYCRNKIIEMCRYDGITCNMIRYGYGNDDEFTIILKMTIPLS